MTLLAERRLEPGPFAGVLERGELPAPFRRQFLDGAALLSGRMDSVWHRPRWIRPLLALLARWDVLFPDVGAGVPADRRIVPVAPGVHAWERRFAFTRERRFDALMVWDARHRRVVERTGPFEIAWDVRFLAPDRMEIQTVGSSIRVLGRRMPVPRLLAPEVTAVEHAVGPDRIHVRLELAHCLLGGVFGYSGTFRLEGA